MLRTNTKKYKSNIKNYILSAVNDDLENATDLEKLTFICNDFKRVCNHKYNLKRYPTTQNRLADYLQGLPFHFVDAYRYDIIKTAEKLLECTLKDEKLKERIVNNYYNHLASHIIRIISEETNLDIHKISIY